MTGATVAETRRRVRQAWRRVTGLGVLVVKGIPVCPDGTQAGGIFEGGDIWGSPRPDMLGLRHF
jgi:hypothetical protein